MENFEQKFLEAIAKKILEQSIDDYNNKVNSPIVLVLERWIKNNENEIMNKLKEIIDIEELANQISIKVINVSKEAYDSDYYKNTFSEELRKATIAKLADKIAKEKFKEEKFN